MTRRARILLVALLAGLAATPGEAATRSVTGSYELSDVPEAGGALRLDPDGRYHWAVSLKRVNRSSTGRWTREGDQILLTPDDPENPSGFTRAELSSWDEPAERRYLRAAAESSWFGLLDRCPLLRVKALTYPPPPADLTRDWRRYAYQASRAAAQARKRANAAIARWASAQEGTPAADAALRDAAETIAAHHKAGHDAEQAHARAGLEPPLWVPLDYPARCLPQRAPADYEPLPAERHPQIGIIVGDREGASAFLGTRLELIFSDGSRVTAVSGPGGWASLPVRPGSSLAAIRLSIDDTGSAPIRVPVALSGAGVVVMDINPVGADARKLEPSSLRIAADGSLRAAQGVYLR